MIIDCQNIKCKKSFNTDDSSRSNRKAVWYVCPHCGKKYRLINEISDRDYVRQADGSLRRKNPKPISKSEKRRLKFQKRNSHA